MKSLYYIAVIVFGILVTGACKKIDGKYNPVGFQNSHVFTQQGGIEVFHALREEEGWGLHSLTVNGDDIPLFEDSELVKLHYRNQRKTPLDLVKIEGSWISQNSTK